MTTANGGYILKHMEVYNWGNFHGWQQFDLASEESLMSTPLFPVVPHSMITGINGSGKSTLIDAIMATLLPFESSTKLGVTHDHEAGGGGGRKVNDYVMGKFSSNHTSEHMALENVYGRHSDISITLLVFQHQSNPKKIISIGRLWWYQKYKIKDQNILFIAHEELSIIPKKPKDTKNLAHHSGRPFASAREFKQEMGTRDLRLQIFEKNQQYFANLNLIFGGLQKDDLKLLNQAFYVKSIGQIDTFIRQHMLVENKNEFIERLIDSVKKAKEITANIEICEKKLLASERIIQELQRYQKYLHSKEQYEQDERVARIYPIWQQWNDQSSEIKNLKEVIQQYQNELPHIKEQIENIQYAYDTQKSQLDGNQSTLAIENYRREAQLKGKELQHKEMTMLQVAKLANILEIKPPKRFEQLDNFIQSYSNCGLQLLGIEQELEEKKSQFYLANKEIEFESNEIKKELQFLSTHKTLIPERIYSIKERCLAELKLPSHALIFVGEVIAIKKGEENYRLAVESVLNPISKNILCHPDYLEKVTLWMNKNRLTSTITIKRIKEDELYLNNEESFDQSSILAKIEVKPDPQENPFSNYIWNWLHNSFYHLIVTEKEFKKDIPKAVTVEGLVKQDKRTMKKYKANLEFCLGWNSKERQDELVAKLMDLNKRQGQIKIELEAISNQMLKQRPKLSAVENLKNINFDYFDIPELKRDIQNIEKHIQDLEKKDQDYKALKEKVEMLEKELENLKDHRAYLNAQIKSSENQLTALGKSISEKRRELDSAIGTKDAQIEFEQKFQHLLQYLHQKGLSHFQYTENLVKARQEVEKRLEDNPAKALLKDYKQAYQDPNLLYEFNTNSKIDDFLTIWQQAKDDIQSTGLPKVKKKWQDFFNNTLLESVKSSINQIKVDQNIIKDNIDSINRVLYHSNFEDLPIEKRYLKIESLNSKDDRIRKFLRDIHSVEKVISSDIRSLGDSESSKASMEILEPFVQELQDDNSYRDFVVDVRNHFVFNVQSWRRKSEKSENSESKDQDQLVEIFTGARKDAKSSAQTTQLAYALLASSLAYRFHFNDPVKGQDTLRLIILDEFGGKFDNEKPKDILHLLNGMGFQAILVTPMSKVELLAKYTSKIVFVHKISPSHSTLECHTPTSLEAYKKAEMEKFKEIVKETDLETAR